MDELISDQELINAMDDLDLTDGGEILENKTSKRKTHSKILEK